MEANFTRAGLKIKLGSQIPEIIELEAAKVNIMIELPDEQGIFDETFDETFE